MSATPSESHGRDGCDGSGPRLNEAMHQMPKVGPHQRAPDGDRVACHRRHDAGGEPALGRVEPKEVVP